MSTKKLAQRKHAKRRANERFGLTLNRHQLADVARQIQSGKSVFVRRQSNRVTVHQVSVGEAVCQVVYDSARNQIVTFLPPEACG